MRSEKRMCFMGLFLLVCVSGALSFFLAGGYYDHNINDTCAIEIAKDTAALLPSTPSFMSGLDSSLSDCVANLTELKEVKSQVLI